MSGAGTSNSSQNQQSSLTGYQPAMGAVNGILGSINGLSGSAGSLTGTQQGAIDQITANSNGTPNYAPQINSGVYGLLNGGGAQSNDAALKSGLGNYTSGMSTYTDPNYSTVNSAPVRAALDQVASDTTNSVNSNWAAAGRDGSPGNAQALGRGIAAAQAPIILNQANQDTATRQNALNSVYGAGNTTYGMLNQNQGQANTNFQNGVGAIGAGVNAENAAPNAALQAAAMQFGIPASQLTTLLGAVSPVAAQFGTQTGQTQGSQTMSPIQQFAMAGQGAANWGKFLFGG